MDDEGLVLRLGIVDMQVCVPSDWTNDQIVEFANRNGYYSGNYSLREDAELLAGCPIRNPCEKDESRVHVTLDEV